MITFTGGEAKTAKQANLRGKLMNILHETIST